MGFSYEDIGCKINSISICGSWNHFNPIEMNKFDDNQRYYLSISLQPGRYYYFYKVNSKEGGLFHSVDQNSNLLQSKLFINDNEESVTILRIYSFLSKNKEKL